MQRPTTFVCEICQLIWERFRQRECSHPALVVMEGDLKRYFALRLRKGHARLANGDEQIGRIAAARVGRQRQRNVIGKRDERYGLGVEMRRFGRGKGEAAVGKFPRDVGEGV